jgi:hypothetical protein
MASSFARGLFLGTLRKSNGNKLVTYDEDMVFLLYFISSLLPLLSLPQDTPNQSMYELCVA